MSKLLIFLTLTNVIIYGVATFFNTHLTLFWFVLLVYLLPLILNSLLVIFTHQKYKLGSSCLAALTTTVCYLMFSLYFTTRDTFPDFLKNNTKYYGEMQLDINPNLASLSQLIFIFSLNFIIICSINIIVRKKVKHRVTR